MSNVLGKAKRVKFGTGTHQTKEILEYIQSDLWGPSKIPTHANGRYFISIIDDFSRRVWVYILKSKDEAFLKFKEWKTLVENQTGKRIKRLNRQWARVFF